MSTKEKTKSKLPTVDPKLQVKAKEAQAALEAYLKKNKLDPSKDWSKDKKHGTKVKELVLAVSIARDKIKEAAPAEIHHKKSEDKKKETKKGGSSRGSSKYDYPLVNGKEMTSEQKKKYRSEMRKKATGSEKKKDVVDKKADAKKAVPAPAPSKKVTSKKPLKKSGKPGKKED